MYKLILISLNHPVDPLKYLFRFAFLQIGQLKGHITHAENVFAIVGPGLCVKGLTPDDDAIEKVKSGSIKRGKLVGGFR